MKDMELNAKKNANDLPRRPAWSSRPSVQSTSSKGLPPPSSSVPNRSGRTVLPSARSTKASKPIDTTTTTRREKDRDREKSQTKKAENAILSVASGSSDRNISSNSPANTISAPRALTPLEDSDRASSVAETFSTNEQPSNRPIPGAPPPPGLSLPTSSSEEITSYQPSTAAQALLDDVRSRRHQQRADSVDAPSYSGNSPFPDFDRTLQILRIGSNDAHNDTGLKFSFDFDADDISTDAPNPLNFNLPPAGTFNPMTRAPPPAPIGRYTSNFDPFASSSPGAVDSTQDSRLSNPPGGYDARYRGAFDPFADVDASSVPSQASPALSFAASYDGERTTSRFDFARRGTPTRTFPPLPGHLGNDGRRGSPLISSPIESQPAAPHLFHGAATPPRQPSHTQTTVFQVPQSQNSPPSIPPGLGHVTSQSISLSQLFGTNFSQPQLAPAGDLPPGLVDRGARNPMNYQNNGKISFLMRWLRVVMLRHRTTCRTPSVY
jgi:CCR4-NOT transcription complex subunit 4